MGLSVAISGGIIMFGIIYLMFSLSGLTDSIASISDSSMHSSDLENKLVKTSIVINSITATGTTPDVGIVIKNNGIEKLWEFEKFNVIITYDSSGTTYTENLTYAATCPSSSGQWCPLTFNNDVIDPKILNYNETLSIDAKVSNNITSLSNVICVVSTQNGVVATGTTVA